MIAVHTETAMHLTSIHLDMRVSNKPSDHEAASDSLTEANLAMMIMTTPTL